MMKRSPAKVYTLPDEHGNIASSLEYFLNFKIEKNSKILDIGCNQGSLIYNFYKRGYSDVSGIDVNKDVVGKGKKGYPEIKDRLIVYDGKKIPFEDSSFDVITMFDVIEHIPDIGSFMSKEIYRVLKKDGIFIFQTPNKRINVPWEIISKKSLTAWKKYHCSLQTPRSLRALLKKSGFKKIVVEKNTLLTEHNKKKVSAKLGTPGIMMLKTFQKMPLSLYPNLWGSCRK